MSLISQGLINLVSPALLLGEIGGADFSRNLSSFRVFSSLYLCIYIYSVICYFYSMYTIFITYIYI